tara:strand:+ start:1466 stop:2551 length:1086 start_codon:yes stop_codon:yes gene_type:complete
MSNKIVDTRKLNKDKRARLGRFGDTKIREIDGQPSHVTALESVFIDIDKESGEKFAKDVGAGTINPYTGLKEYNAGDEWNWGDALGSLIGGESKEEFDRRKAVEDAFAQVEWSSARERFGSNPNVMSESEVEKAFTEFGVTATDMDKYLTGFEQKPFDFIQQEYDLNQQQSQIDYDKLDVRKDALDVQRDQLGSDLDFTNRQLGATKDFAMEGMQNQFSDTSQALGRQYRAGAKGALGQSQAMQARSGLASSGGAQYGMQTQLKELAKGQSEGMDTARRNFAFGQRQAQSTYDFGTERAQSAYDFGIKGLDLDTRTLGTDYAGVSLGKYRDTLSYQKGMYGEGRRQKDRFYDEIAELESVK